MKISVQNKLFLFAIVSMIVILITSYAVYESNQKLAESVKWVDHTEQVIIKTEKIRSQVIDIETASNSFVITDDSVFLEPLILSLKTIFADISELRQLTIDNVSQTPRIDSLEYYVRKRIDFSNIIIELRSTKGLKETIAFIATKQGKYYSDRIRQLSNTIQKEETELLKERKETNIRSITAFNWVSAIMLMLMLVLIIILSRGANNYLRLNKEKEKKSSELITANNEITFQHSEKEKQVAANKELEAFSYSVSHDLRAPLRHIGGFVDLLIKNNGPQLNESGLRYLNIISESSHEMGNLIDALLSFSRLSRSEMQKTKINSKEMVNKVLKTFSEDLKGRNVEFNINDLPDAYGDENLISLVWTNLISNALKYSKNKEKTVINIGGETGMDTTMFYIRDNGAGFDMKYADKLFGVFQRLHKARDFEGIGIGLANVHRIITRHNGNCWAESEVGNGATFHFSLKNT
jgi:signal transduction histidine kinase